jgi:hypothetical protein
LRGDGSSRPKLGVVPENQDPLADLYAVERDEFVAARNRLARSLRTEGEEQQAREVAALRKPPLPVYLANRLARERARELGALLDTAERLSRAHRSGEAETLREAHRELGERVRKLVSAAPEIAGGPVTESAGQRLAETLRAAASDPTAAALLRRGVLPDELEAAGFDALAGMSLRRPAEGKPQPSRSRTRPGRADSTRRARAERLAKELADAKRELRSAERALTAADHDANRARKRVSDLEARVERAR